MSDSFQKKLNRVRKPRVHITYDVEGDEGTSKQELPFVVGVMGDYSGDNTEAKKSFKERKFLNIDRDNFNDIMSKTKPTLSLSVEDKLSGEEDKQMNVNLEFNSMDDFEPANIINQVEPLKKLLEARNNLRDLMSKADRSEDLESLLEEVLQNSDAISQLNTDLGNDEQTEGDQ